MTREAFLDIVNSVGASAEIAARAAVDDGRPHPHVTVTYQGQSQSWERPTYRQAFAEAVTWLESVVR